MVYVGAMPKKRPYDQYCPIACALDVVGDRWSMLIVRELFLGPTRYGELLDALETISTDVLAKRLRELESNDVLRRQNDGSYELTANGRNLAPVLLALGGWGHELVGPDSGSGQPTAARAMQMLVLKGTDVAADPHRGDVQTIEVHADDLIWTVTSGAHGLAVRRGLSDHVDARITSTGATLWAIGFGELSWADATASGAILVDGDAVAAERLVDGVPSMATQATNT
jgi:DNA-binding HxlR family transcriptional regulator